MGAAGSLQGAPPFATAEEALEAGKTQAEVDAWVVQWGGGGVGSAARPLPGGEGRSRCHRRRRWEGGGCRDEHQEGYHPHLRPRYYQVTNVGV